MLAIIQGVCVQTHTHTRFKNQFNAFSASNEAENKYNNKHTITYGKARARCMVLLNVAHPVWKKNSCVI